MSTVGLFKLVKGHFRIAADMSNLVLTTQYSQMFSYGNNKYYANSYGV